jgi:hypothetical protein
VILFLQTLDFTAADRRGHQERVIHIGSFASRIPQTAIGIEREEVQRSGFAVGLTHQFLGRRDGEAALPIVFFPFALCLFCSN